MTPADRAARLFDRAEVRGGEAFARGELGFEQLAERCPLLFHLVGALPAGDDPDLESVRDYAIARLTDLVAARWRPRDPAVRQGLWTLARARGVPRRTVKRQACGAGVVLALARMAEPVAFWVSRLPLEVSGGVIAPPIAPWLEFLPAITPHWFRRQAIAAAERYVVAETTTPAAEITTPPEVLARFPQPDRAADDGGRLAATWAARIGAAGPRQRQLLERWLQTPDAPLAEVARALGITPNAARQAIDRLRRRAGSGHPVTPDR